MAKTLKTYQNLILFTVAIIFIIGSAEVLLRVISPIYYCDTVSQYCYDGMLGVRKQPNLHKRIFTDHLIEIMTNDSGAKNFLDTKDLQTYSKIILCIGDSYTEGVGTLVDQNYPFYLDLLLNITDDHYEKSYGVINLGVSGYGSKQSYFMAKSYAGLLQKKPTYIIYLISQNDLADDARFSQKQKHPYPYFLLKLNGMFEHSQIYFRAKLLLRKFFGDDSSKKSSLSSQKVTRSFDPLALTGLNNLISYTRNSGITLIISYVDYPSEEYDKLKNFCAGNKIIFADYKPLLMGIKTTLTNLPVSNEHSGGHYRSWVNFIIASRISMMIKDR